MSMCWIHVSAYSKCQISYLNRTSLNLNEFVRIQSKLEEFDQNIN